VSKSPMGESSFGVAGRDGGSGGRASMSKSLMGESCFGVESRHRGGEGNGVPGALRSSHDS
jgi:hypothetical protein